MTHPSRGFSELLSDIRHHFVWTDFRALLKSSGFETAPGWDQLVEKFEALDSAKQAPLKTFLTNLRKDLVFAGTKDLQVFCLPEAEVVGMAAEAAAIQIDSPNFGHAFPHALNETALHDLAYQYELAAKTVHANGDVALVFCAKRTFEDRTPYEADEVTAAVRAAFAGYDRFIAIRRVHFQIFDIINLRSSMGRVELLIDRPDRIQKPETSSERCQQLLAFATALMPSLLNICGEQKPLNLFPSINNLYEAKREGRISRLFLRSPTDSIKRESMTSTKDLRTEKFHAAGVAAVGAITPFDITVCWNDLINVHASVDVRVSMPMSGLSSAFPHVGIARISGAPSDAAVYTVANKLVSYST